MAMEDIIGSVIGAGANLWNAEQERDYNRALQRQKERALQNALTQANAGFREEEDLLSSYDRNRIRLADPTTVQEYRQLLDSYNPQAYEFGKFGDEYNKTVEDFMNPEAERIAELAGLKTQAQMAGQGAAKGTGALAGMGYSRWEAARDLYNDAQQQYNADRSQAYREYGDYIDRMQNKLDTISQGQLQKAQLLGGAITNEQQAEADYLADLLGLKQDKISTNINATLGAF